MRAESSDGDGEDAETIARVAELVKANEEANESDAAVESDVMVDDAVRCWDSSEASTDEVDADAGVLTATEGLGIQAMAKDLGIKLHMSLYLDAKAAIAIMSREGLSKVKHIETRFLWIQDAIKAKREE